MTVIESIRRKFEAISPVLGERARRLWTGTEAEALGRGGVAWVARATGMAISTVRKGRDEVRAGVLVQSSRERREGGGRRRLEAKDPELIPALESLVSPVTRGDPESPLRWTCKSVRVLARELTKAQHPVGASKVRALLRTAGYSLQANSKTKEGIDHPDRNEQFEFINKKAQDFVARGLPVISVDAKKKESIAPHGNSGREWEPKGSPVEVRSHDFFDTGAPSAIPYGIYDIGKNLGFVNIGTDHNTPTFAARSMEKWWDQIGLQLYPYGKEIFVTADAGGSNASRSLVWKANLQDLADRKGLTIHVSHFPPGTSKWNKIEHRLFSFISLNWRGRPLATYETIVSLIAGTTTTKGLKVKAELDLGKYPIGVRVKEHVLHTLNVERAGFHGEWNFIIRPRTAAQIAAANLNIPDHIPLPHAETRARWAALVREQVKRGQDKQQFCRAKGVSYESFMRNRARLLGKIRIIRRKHKPLTSAQWAALVYEQAKSGFENRHFCREHGIDYSNFMRHRVRLLGKIRVARRTPK
jgi:hypothetical protein